VAQILQQIIRWIEDRQDPEKNSLLDGSEWCHGYFQGLEECKQKIEKYITWKYEVCRKCGRKQRMAWSVKDSLWEKVVPKNFKDKVLCLECFLEMADQRHINVRSEDFNFLGWMGENIKGDILIGNSNVD